MVLFGSTREHSYDPNLVPTGSRILNRSSTVSRTLSTDLRKMEGTVDLQPLFFKLTFDTTMFLLFGDSVSALEWGDVAGEESEFAQAFNLAQDYLAHRGRLGQFYWLLNDRAFREACRKCHCFVDEAVEKALLTSAKIQEVDSTEKRGEYVFIEALAQQSQHRKVLRDQCFNLLLAGRDTTGCCLSWTFRLLSRHQRVLGKLRSEIENVCGLGFDSEPPTRDQLKQMAYPSLVIKEGLNPAPSPSFLTPRLILDKHILIIEGSYSATFISFCAEAIRMTTLPVGGGPDGKSPILVRPGEAVGYCVYAMHRRKDLYGDDAEEFRPERWEGDKLKDVGWAYLPFNAGPRLCLGRKKLSTTSKFYSFIWFTSSLTLLFRGVRTAGSLLYCVSVDPGLSSHRNSGVRVPC
ncbi:Cytochrome P450 52A2 [Cytospora mali]|uniref:Cytochrome P450 52A2 n=1 Tax=Cytospora mali TaxID=578113 RepID=A0A194VEC7_CYTMA|nr:Cytochrome P450 52A2 [Valsa mali var. pyri (nom. inval.)]